MTLAGREEPTDEGKGPLEGRPPASGKGAGLQALKPSRHWARACNAAYSGVLVATVCVRQRFGLLVEPLTPGSPSAATPLSPARPRATAGSAASPQPSPMDVDAVPPTAPLDPASPTPASPDGAAAEGAGGTVQLRMDTPQHVQCVVASQLRRTVLGGVRVHLTDHLGEKVGVGIKQARFLLKVRRTAATSSRATTPEGALRGRARQPH